MKNLQDLVQHPSFQNGDAILMATGQAITLVTGAEKKSMGQPLNSQALINLLKASVSPDIQANFQWGKDLNISLRTGDAIFPMRVHLTHDKSIRIEIQLKEDEPKSAPPAPQPELIPSPGVSAPAPPQSEEIDENLINQLTNGENLALIYYTDSNAISAVEKAADLCGHDPRKTDHPGAVSEVLKYTQYPLFFMVLGSDYREDPVYRDFSALNMSRRRDIYSVLVAPGLKSGDTMLAWSLSVNLTVDSHALQDLQTLINKGVKDWNNYVGTFHELLAEAGKL